MQEWRIRCRIKCKWENMSLKINIGLFRMRCNSKTVVHSSLSNNRHAYWNLQKQIKVPMTKAQTLKFYFCWLSIFDHYVYVFLSSSVYKQYNVIIELVWKIKIFVLYSEVLWKFSTLSCIERSRNIYLDNPGWRRSTRKDWWLNSHKPSTQPAYW